MNNQFEEGFEKTAFFGAVKSIVAPIAKAGWGLAKRFVTKAGPGGTRTIAPGRALTSGFMASEAAGVVSKVKKSETQLKSVASNGLKNLNFNVAR